MLSIEDTLGGERITFHYARERSDLSEVASFVRNASSLGIDTESTHFNCYRPGWQLRTYQVGNAERSYVIPAKRRRFLAWLMRQPINWIGHNGPHDIRCIDEWLQYETGVQCVGETFIPAHHHDSRGQEDGGVKHALKEQAVARLAPDAGKWEVELKKEFKNILIPMEGVFYKSGKRKGEQRYRKAKLAEGWGLIDPEHPAYLAYAAADPLLTYRLWRHYQPVVRNGLALYQFDRRIAQIGDTLQRRGMRLDARYTKRLNAAYLERAEEFKHRAEGYGCNNINSGAQIAATLQELGATLKDRTPTGQYKTDDGVLRLLAESCKAKRVPESGIDASESALYIEDFIHCVLGAKQLLKRRENYTEAMLREMDANGRIHASIKTLGARTTRMSVGGPPLQQLPTKDREGDE